MKENELNRCEIARTWDEFGRVKNVPICELVTVELDRKRREEVESDGRVE